jgi:hypothetical protein
MRLFLSGLCSAGPGNKAMDSVQGGDYLNVYLICEEV